MSKSAAPGEEGITVNAFPEEQRQFPLLCNERSTVALGTEMADPLLHCSL